MAAVCVQNLLIEPDNFGVFYALCQVYTIHDVSHEQEERDFLRQETMVPPPCVYPRACFFLCDCEWWRIGVLALTSHHSGVNEILLQNNCLFPFIEYVVKREIDACAEANTLFRQRTVFTLLLADILKRQACGKNACSNGGVLASHVPVQCASYTNALRRYLRPSRRSKDSLPLIRHSLMICRKTRPTPVLQKLSSWPMVRASSSVLCAVCRLLTRHTGVLQTVRRNFSKCPPSLRKICEFLSSAAAAKFPELRWSILGSVLFLRFLCPAICSPENFSFVTKEVTAPQRKVRNACGSGEMRVSFRVVHG